jgi:quercetin dioxygenase-like cupin family protein
VNFDRRDLGFLFLAFALTSAAAQERPSASRTYRYEDLKVNTNGENRSRPILNEKMHSGFGVELHETELAPGLAPHPPHRHDHEEMILIREGTLEVTISGRSVNLGPGSVALVASNEEHGWRNVGTTRARYFVIALGRPVPERK